jgi:hypothetical protein
MMAKVYDYSLSGFGPIALLITLVVVRFMYTVRTFLYPIGWGIFLYAFTSDQLLPWWIDLLGILIVVVGRFWLLFSRGR